LNAYKRTTGFSLVEVVIALGVVTFALLSVMALLPIGVKINQVSAEETRAAMILTALESDLRNTYPSAIFNGRAAGRSQIYGLTLPYALSAGTVVANSTLVAQNMSTALASAASGFFTTGLDANEKTVTASQSRYRATVIYTRVPTSGSLAPIEARLIVNWPGLSESGTTTYTIADLTDLTKVSGFVEETVTFQVP
jgi:type II secretory pathway pseudopilin PulG